MLSRAPGKLPKRSGEPDADRRVQQQLVDDFGIAAFRSDEDGPRICRYGALFRGFEQLDQRPQLEFSPAELTGSQLVNDELSAGPAESWVNDDRGSWCRGSSTGIRFVSFSPVHLK